MQIQITSGNVSNRYYGEETMGRTFEQAQRDVSKWSTSSVDFTRARQYNYNAGCTLERIGSIYCVIRRGIIIGKGLHFEVAIADAESNLSQ